MTTIIYAVNDYNTVEDNNFGNHRYLSSETLSMITDLTEQVSSPSYSRTPSFPVNALSANQDKDTNITHMTSSTSHSSSSYTNKYMSSSTSESNYTHSQKGRNGNNSKMSHYKKVSHTTTSINNANNNKKGDDLWRGPKTSFQPTKIQRKKVGNKGTMDEIRLLLNKLTDKTYNKISEQIVDIVSTLEAQDIKKDIIQQIINVACINNINCKSYADLLNDVDIQLGVSEGECINDTIALYSESFSELLGITSSPDTDYDKFCEMNLSNNKRKGTTQFFCYLTESNLVSESKLNELFEYMTSLLKGNMNTNNALTCNEELVENLFVICRYILNLNNIKKSNKSTNMKQAQNRLFHEILSHDYSSYITKKQDGITQKAKFKMMDIKDLINKHKI